MTIVEVKDKVYLNIMERSKEVIELIRIGSIKNLKLYSLDDLRYQGYLWKEVSWNGHANVDHLSWYNEVAVFNGTTFHKKYRSGTVPYTPTEICNDEYYVIPFDNDTDYYIK